MIWSAQSVHMKNKLFPRSKHKTLREPSQASDLDSDANIASARSNTLHKRGCFFYSLPEELWLTIFEYLPEEYVKRMMLVHRFFYPMTLKFTWKRLVVCSMLHSDYARVIQLLECAFGFVVRLQRIRII